MSVRGQSVTITRTTDNVTVTNNGISLVAPPKRLVLLCGLPRAWQVMTGATTQKVTVDGFSMTLCP